MSEEVKLLKEIASDSRHNRFALRQLIIQSARTNYLLSKLLGIETLDLQIDQADMGFLAQIESDLHPPTQLTIRSLTMQQFDPGATGIVLQAAFTPAGATAPNPGFPVAWTDSNSFATFVNDPTDGTGFTQDVTLAASATVGTSGVI